MSKGNSPPPAPDPSVIAANQYGSNVNSAAAQAAINNVNKVGPTGSTTYNVSGYQNVGGVEVPQYTQTTTLTPQEQQILSATQDIGVSEIPTAQTLAGQAGTTATTPLNVNQTANNGIISAGPQALDPSVAQAAYNASTQFLTPTFSQQQKDLQDQLSRQGISVGSDAYSNAETQLQNSQNAALTGAANNAVVTGANQANNMFGLALQGQNQNIGQQQTVQQQPLQLLSQLYSAGAVNGTPS